MEGLGTFGWLARDTATEGHQWRGSNRPKGEGRWAESKHA